MTRALVSFLCGLIFGVGLIVSQMSNPAKVIGFLDIGGQWDPSLAFVMAGAVAVFSIAYRLALRRHEPIFDKRFLIPEKTRLDKPLIIGSLIFGAGWGLAGLCPGPAIVSSGYGDPRVWALVAAMLAGTVLMRAIRRPSH
jgi:uncharacterized membrane protein YedE/YeeE